MRRSTAVTVLAVASGLVLAGCGGSSSGSASASKSPSGSASGASATATCTPTAAAKPAGPSVTTKVGVTVSGAAGKLPVLTIPKVAAPSKTSVEVLTAGTGPDVQKGDVLVANYLGQTWADKNCAPNVFDSSFKRGTTAGFAIGVGKVVKGWDSTLVGQKLGSRVLLAITPDDGYGPKTTAQAGQAPNELAGETLVFVVDLVDRVKGDGIASGATQKLPAGFPAITSASGKHPEVTSVSGVKPPKEPTSASLIKGTGAKIDENKQLVLQFLQTDLATGKKTQRTWDAKQPEVVPAKSVLTLVSALKGQAIGSRAVAVTPDEAQQPASVLVVDVIGQF